MNKNHNIIHKIITVMHIKNIINSRMWQNQYSKNKKSKQINNKMKNFNIKKLTSKNYKKLNKL